MDGNEPRTKSQQLQLSGQGRASNPLSMIAWGSAPYHHQLSLSRRHVGPSSILEERARHTYNPPRRPAGQDLTTATAAISLDPAT
jgi:hypothetical protein